MNKPTQARKRPSLAEWAQIKSAYLAGAELRPLARAIGIPEGTLLSRASRDGWAEERSAARDRVAALCGSIEDVSQSIAVEREQRAQRHLDRMSCLTESVGDRVQRMSPVEALDRIHKISIFDRLARRALGLDDRRQEERPALINLAILTMDTDQVIELNAQANSETADP
jgi:hypothetical protein